MAIRLLASLAAPALALAAAGSDAKTAASHDGTCGSAGGEADACADDTTELLQHHRTNLEATGRLDWFGGQTTPPPCTGLVAELYTYGAPATAEVAFTNPCNNGCFPGLRSYTENLLAGGIKQVDAAAINNPYAHATMTSVVLHENVDSYYTICNKTSTGHPDWPMNGAQVYQEWRIHSENSYRPRLDAVTVNGQNVAGFEPFLSARKFALLAWKAYDTPANAKAAIAEQMPGWRLILQVVDAHGSDTDPVWLYQEKSTLDCALVFTGTNSASEYSTSTTQYLTGYCGFPKVHVGYRNELWDITTHLWPALRPKLQHCKRVISVGHSLGGSLAELFAACANTGRYDDPDYQLLAWKKETPLLMPEFEG